MECSVVQGDIAEQSADVLVNAASTSLRKGSGVAGFDIADGARAICEAIDAHEPDSLSAVRVIAYTVTRRRRSVA